MGSASGHTGSEFPAYAASKGGVIAYTKNLANRLAPQAIANSVDPGGVITPLNRCVMEDEHLWNQIMELTPLKRWATAQEIAEWIYFCLLYTSWAPTCCLASLWAAAWACPGSSPPR